jgi:hypothetical protein
MAIKSLHQFFYYHNKYLNSMKCREINMGPSKCTIQCSPFHVYHTIETHITNICEINMKITFQKIK